MNRVSPTLLLDVTEARLLRGQVWVQTWMPSVIEGSLDVKDVIELVDMAVET